MCTACCSALSTAVMYGFAITIRTQCNSGIPDCKVDQNIPSLARSVQ